MIHALQYRRLAGLTFLLAMAFVGLGYRLVDLQVWRHAELGARAQENTRQMILRQPRRGDILDIRGNLLATSVLAKKVCADPALVQPHQKEVAALLAPLLDLPVAHLQEALQTRTRLNSRGEVITNRYVVLKRKVRLETWEEVQRLLNQTGFDTVVKVRAGTLVRKKKLSSNAIFAEEDPLRVYPNESLASHVLGFVSMEPRQIGEDWTDEMVGKDGIELSLDSKLKGVRGWRRTEADRRRRELVIFRDQDIAPRSGLNVVLTLDIGLQDIVEEQLQEGMQRHEPQSGSAIVIRPRTGEILALANLPKYDPNDPGASPADARRNRVITDIAEPGSTFKVVVVSAALNEGVVNLDDAIDCEEGVFVYGGVPLRDTHSHGVLSVEQIVSKSSNIGAAKIGLKLGPARLLEYLRGFGFGERMGVPLGGEARGTIHPLERWSKLSITRIPMGHEVAVTQLQLAMAICAIANGGRLMRPMLVDRLADDAGRTVAKYSPRFVRQVVTEATAQKMIQAMTHVVSSNGTAAKARLEHYVVAGKTGTAQKAGEGGYLPGKYYSSFIGVFPAQDPELCISVVFNEPKLPNYYGGETAAPVFRAIAERAANYLNVRPSLLTDDPAAPELSEAERVATNRSRSRPTTARSKPDSYYNETVE